MENLPSKPLYGISRGRLVNSDNDCNCRKHVTVGKGHTHLQMITSKRTNRMDPKNLETLLLLAALKIPCKKPDMYENEVVAVSWVWMKINQDLDLMMQQDMCSLN